MQFGQQIEAPQESFGRCGRAVIATLLLEQQVTHYLTEVFGVRYVELLQVVIHFLVNKYGNLPCHVCPLKLCPVKVSLAG